MKIYETVVCAVIFLPSADVVRTSSTGDDDWSDIF